MIAILALVRVFSQGIDKRSLAHVLVRDQVVYSLWYGIFFRIWDYSMNRFKLPSSGHSQHRDLVEPRCHQASKRSDSVWYTYTVCS